MSIPRPTRAECEEILDCEDHIGTIVIKRWVSAYLTQSDENEALAKALVDQIDASHDARCADLRVVSQRSNAALAEYAKRKQEGGI